MSDPVLDAFLRAQLVQARRLAAESDLLRIQPEAGDAPSRYLVHFHGEGLVRLPDASIHRASHFVIGAAFPDNYLRGPATQQFVTMSGAVAAVIGVALLSTGRVLDRPVPTTSGAATAAG